MRNLIKIIACFFLFSSIVSCGGFKKVDARKVPISGPERAKKNVREGRGVSLGSMMNKGRGSTNYGVIISDWYTDNTNKSQALKITVRFLSNKVQSNSVKVTVHKKQCSVNQTCNVEIFKSRIQEELIASILKEAAILEKQQKK
jgi:hypothetical protein